MGLIIYMKLNNWSLLSLSLKNTCRGLFQETSWTFFSPDTQAKIFGSKGDLYSRLAPTGRKEADANISPSGTCFLLNYPMLCLIIIS